MTPFFLSEKAKAAFGNLRLFALILLIAWLLLALGRDHSGWDSPHFDFYLVVLRPLCLIGTLALLTGALAWWMRSRAIRLLPATERLWGLLALGTLLLFVADYNSAIFFSPSSVFTTVGAVCLSWSVLRHHAAWVWIPLLFWGIIQYIAYQNSGVILHGGLTLSEIFDASWHDVAALITLPGIAAALFALGAAALGTLLLNRLLRAEKRLTLVLCGLLFLLLAAVDMVATPPALRPGCMWPLREVVITARNARTAIAMNDALVDTLKRLPSPAEEQSSSLATSGGARGIVLVLHIGESVRADRLSFNGYSNKGRSTTPQLDRLAESSLISFRNCISSSPTTCPALIALLTDARRDIRFSSHPDYAARTGSVLELFAANNFSVYSLLGKPELDASKYDKILSLLLKCSTKKYHAPGFSHTGLKFAEAILRESPQENKLLFIQNEGSHMPFNAFDAAHAPFQPVHTTAERPQQNEEGLNNAYDNTIYYTDSYIGKLLRMLEGRPFLYLFISDHGEYLGHGGNWFRGCTEDKDYYHSTSACRAAMFAITSPEFEALHPHFAESINNLRAHAGMTVGHEHLFHTLLGIFGITTPHYRAELDLSGMEPAPYTGPQPGTKDAQAL